MFKQLFFTIFAALVVTVAANTPNPDKCKQEVSTCQWFTDDQSLAYRRRLGHEERPEGHVRSLGLPVVS